MLFFVCPIWFVLGSTLEVGPSCVEGVYTLSSRYPKNLLTLGNREKRVAVDLLNQKWESGEEEEEGVALHGAPLSLPAPHPHCLLCLCVGSLGDHAALVTLLKVEVRDGSVPGGILRDLGEPDRLVSFRHGAEEPAWVGS